MKRLAIIIACLILMSLSGAAQRSTRSKRTATRPKATVAKPIRLKTIAAYEIDARRVTCDYGNIYYAEDNNNNPLVFISGESGKGVDWIKGKADVYENIRPGISGIYPFDQCIVLETSKPMQRVRFLVWDGKSELDNCPELEGWAEIKGYNGRYTFIVNRQDDYELWDMADRKRLQKWQRYTTMMPEYGQHSGPLFIASDLNVWYRKGDDVKTGPIFLNVKEGKFYNCPLSNEDYVKNNNIRQFGAMRKQGDYLYVACGRRIYRINMLTHNKWEEYLRIPPTEDNEFENFCITSNGSVFAIGKRVELYRAGDFDNPRLLGTGRKLKTGLKPYSHQEIWLNLSKIRVDARDNFIILNDKTIYVYNPDGIVGFKDTYGTIVKYR